MVRHGHSDFTERLRNKNTTATATTSAFSVTGVGREPLPFWSPSEMIREHASNPKPLHNFTLPRLRWGSQIPMRCVKAADHSTSTLSSSSISADHLRLIQRSFDQTSFVALSEAVAEEDGEGIEAVRWKLMLDLNTETDKIRKELLKEDEDDRVEAVRAAAVPEEGEVRGGLTDVTATAQSKKDGGAQMRPWNLRTRRAACRAPAAKNGSPARRESSFAEKEKVWPSKEKEREKFALGPQKEGSRRGFHDVDRSPSSPTAEEAAVCSSEAARHAVSRIVVGGDNG